MKKLFSFAAPLLSRPPNLALTGVIALGVYLFTAWFVLEAAAPWSPDEGAKLLQMVSLRIEGQALRLDIPYPGEGLDPALDFAISDDPRELFGLINGRLMLERLPIFPLLSLPFYRWIGMAGLYLLPALAGATIGPLALALIGRRDRRILMWILIAFGGPVFIYSILFWEHTLAAGLGLAGVWVVYRVCFGRLHDDAVAPGHSGISKTPSQNAPPGRTWLIALAFLFAGIVGLAIYLRPESLLLAGACLTAGWLLCKERRGWLLLSAVLLGIAMLPYQPLHASLFDGRNLPANARYVYRPTAYLKSAGWQALPDLLIGPGVEESIESGWLGLLWTGSAVLAMGASLLPSDNVATRNLVRLGLGLSAAIAAFFLFDPTPYRSAHGLLFTTPWVLLGATSAPQVWRQGNPRMRATVLTALICLLGYALAMAAVRGSSPHGGLEWGARFILPLFALLALVAAQNTDQRLTDWGSQLDRTILGILVLLGIGFQIRGILTIQHDKQINAALNQVILDIPENNIITDLWWLFPNAAPVYPQKAIYIAKTPWKTAAWIERAASQGVEQFGLATLDYALPAEVNAHLSGYKFTILELIQVENLFIYRIILEPAGNAP